MMQADPARPPQQLYLQAYLSIGSEEGTPSGKVDGTRSVVGNDVVRRLAIVRIDAASGAGGVGSHRASMKRGWRAQEIWSRIFAS